MPSQPDKDRMMGTEEAMASAINQLVETSGEKSRMLSDLNDEEVGTLALLETMGQALEIKVLRDFVSLFCQFRVSRERMGRREISSIVAFAGVQESGRKGSKSMKDLFSGLR